MFSVAPMGFRAVHPILPPRRPPPPPAPTFEIRTKFPETWIMASFEIGATIYFFFDQSCRTPAKSFAMAALLG
ncbi:hypothetical protein TELCIR_22998 [Teladorsagia circumcincta]|uniref:Uncharacterized protein n=1 Tax=Teladorsagia circumcincta TaxID=45464 RepID=A0A2G9TCE5_TELCI|nr:hypothetical protein TELCIR_22998 [Teladorsagia circumcincta]